MACCTYFHKIKQRASSRSKQRQRIECLCVWGLSMHHRRKCRERRSIARPSAQKKEIGARSLSLSQQQHPWSDFFILFCLRKSRLLNDNSLVRSQCNSVINSRSRAFIMNSHNTHSGGGERQREKRAHSKIKRLFFGESKQSRRPQHQNLSAVAHVNYCFSIRARANVFPAFAFLWLHHLLLIAPLNETCTRRSPLSCKSLIRRAERTLSPFAESRKVLKEEKNGANKQQTRGRQTLFWKKNEKNSARH